MEDGFIEVQKMEYPTKKDKAHATNVAWLKPLRS